MTPIIAPAGLFRSRPPIAAALLAGLVVLAGCGTSAPPADAGTNPFADAARSGSPTSTRSPMVVSAPPAQSGRPDTTADSPTHPARPDEGGAPAASQQVAISPPTRLAPSGFTAEPPPPTAEVEPQPAGSLPLAPAPLPREAASPDWPQFRGPAGTGVALRSDLPVSWGDGRNVEWRVRIRGMGSSSPIVSGDYVIVSYYRGYGVTDSNASANTNPQRLERHVACYYRKSGRQKWDHTVPMERVDTPYQGFVVQHGYASSTPVTDGKSVYALFGINGLCAIELSSGRREWNKPVGTNIHEWGTGSSPILYQGSIIVNASVEAGALGAMSRDGNILWSADGVNESWATPVLVETADGAQELVLSMKGQVVAYNPVTGERLWNCRGIDDYVCPSVVAGGGVVYVIGGRSGEAIAVRAGGRGDVSESHVVWKTSKGSNVTSPVLYEGHLYWVGDKGIAYCLDARTGRVLTEKRLDTSNVYASMVAADDKLYVVSRRDGTFVFEAAPEMPQLAHNTFNADDSEFNASPALAHGQLFLRSNEFLYCIGRPASSNTDSTSPRLDK